MSTRAGCEVDFYFWANLVKPEQLGEKKASEKGWICLTVQRNTKVHACRRVKARLYLDVVQTSLYALLSYG